MAISELKRLSTFKMEFNSRELKKEKKRKDLYDIQSKNNFSSELLFLYINKKLKCYYSDAINKQIYLMNQSRSNHINAKI